jgi:hypothetical protein
MKKYFNTTKKQVIGFFLLYALLMFSIIFGVTATPSKTKVDQPPVKSEVAKTFNEELVKYEEKQKEKAIKEAGKWKPSKQFVATAMIIATVLDIVIILVWAYLQNKKRDSAATESRQRLTDKKWFWNVVAMGIVQPKGRKLVVNWKNLVLFIVVMYFLKKIFIDALFNEQRAAMVLMY